LNTYSSFHNRLQFDRKQKIAGMGSTSFVRLALTKVLHLTATAFVVGQISTLFFVNDHAFLHHNSIIESQAGNTLVEEKVAILQSQLRAAQKSRAELTVELSRLNKNLTDMTNLALQLDVQTGAAAKQDIKNSRTTTFSVTRKGRPKLAIAVISAFDWDDKVHFSFQARRHMHRNTWMKHPAIVEGQVVVYFVIGNKQHRKQGNGKLATHSIDELQYEMSQYGDILLLDSPDFHNYGKNNAWYEWAANKQSIQADYHMKLDDESYVLVDRLLASIESAPPQRFLGGMGGTTNAIYGKQTLKDLPFARGWGYIMSEDLLHGLGNCSSSGRVKQNRGELHEDVYHTVALRVCGLHNNLTFWPLMQIHSLRHILAWGCPVRSVNTASVIHCGMRIENKHGGGNAFDKVSEHTFQTLEKIYHPQVSNLAPSWTMWEGLRQLYMEDLGACSPQLSPCGEGLWANRTCLNVGT
jgi:Galactosyltransferase